MVTNRQKPWPSGSAQICTEPQPAAASLHGAHPLPRCDLGLAHCLALAFLLHYVAFVLIADLHVEILGHAVLPPALRGCLSHSMPSQSRYAIATISHAQHACGSAVQAALTGLGRGALDKRRLHSQTEQQCCKTVEAHSPIRGRQLPLQACRAAARARSVMAEIRLISQAGGVHLLALLGGAVYAQSQLHALLDSSLQGSVDGEAGGSGRCKACQPTAAEQLPQ